jgi:hypothetical protein
MSAFHHSTRGYDKDYLPAKDDQLRSEMRIFMDNLAIRAKTEFAVNPSAQERIYVDPTDRTVRGSVMAIPGTGKRIFNHVEYWNEYLKTKKNVTLNEIMYECEKLLQNESKNGSLNMNEIFSKAIEKQVIYVKFMLDARGVGEFDVIASDDIGGPGKQGRVYLRTKNGYTRASDRMGIQV